jgi:hypothetical protein
MSMHLDLQGKILGHLSAKRGEDKLLVDASLVSKVVLVSMSLLAHDSLPHAQPPTSRSRLHVLNVRIQTRGTKHSYSHGLRSLATTLWLSFYVDPRSQTAAKVASSAQCCLSQLQSRIAPVRSTPVPLVKMPVLSSQPLDRSVEISRKRLTVLPGPSFDVPGVPEHGNSSQFM